MKPQFVMAEVQHVHAGGAANNDASDDDNFDDFITLDERNFLQLRSNDPALTSLMLEFGDDCYAQDVDWGVEGGCIATNTHLKKLGLSMYDKDEWYYAVEKMKEFCTGLAGNTTICMLRCDCSLDARHLPKLAWTNKNNGQDLCQDQDQQKDSVASRLRSNRLWIGRGAGGGGVPSK